ncbi:hypothetical protein ACG9FS_004409 [Klebsiella aerogenes]
MIIILLARFPPRRSDFWLFRIFLSPSGALRRRNTTCASRLLHFLSYIVLSSLLRDRPLTTGKGRCGYSLAVVHFRKIGNKRKIGSDRNGYSVI